MTKAEALKRFREEVKPYLTPGDKPMLAEAWNNYTDALCKDGEITMKQYESWTHAGVLSVKEVCMAVVNCSGCSSPASLRIPNTRQPVCLMCGKSFQEFMKRVCRGLSATDLRLADLSEDCSIGPTSLFETCK